MSNKELNWKKLKNWLEERSFNLDLSINPKRFKKGMGNINYKVFVNGKFAVLRRPPLGPIPPGANDMKREHSVMSALSRSNKLVPNSLILCEDNQIIGKPFHIIEFKSGETIDGDTLPNKWNNPKTAKYLSKILIKLLVDIHSIDTKSIGLENLGKPEGFLDRQLEGWYLRGCIAQNNEPTKIMKELYNFLKNDKSPNENDHVILHNDFKLDNIMVRTSKYNNQPEPSAILDWDQATRGHPLYDLATLLSYWTEKNDNDSMKLLKQMPSMQNGFLNRKQALNLYSKLSGKDIQDFNWIYALSLLKLGVVFQQLYAQFLRGTVNDKKYKYFGVIAEASFERGLLIARKEKHI